MLIRFGIIALGVAVLVIIGFTLLMVLKRRGKMRQTRDFIEPLARRLMDQQDRNNNRYDDDRYDNRYNSSYNRSNRPVRNNIKRSAAKAVVNYLNQQADDERGRR
ncbi:hypothetical protein BJ998_002528 [Kutzneria kofuensis]|uniref:Uncharacterized protein n=2 Tax=Kutzneria kofuensis TaxID=103725 RepID=A0A7W9KEU6_9PSEU|nr:hypothetical protein [Kutzneria kofuensis]MBB5891332.1 hypothetical protein [Kutzneria kofuensis]